MNLRWNPDLRRFEAEFHNFREEQPLVKAAGFKTDGAPQWVWWSAKSEPLTKLKENKPAILTINADARVEYAALKVIEDRNAATKAQFAEHKKALKKKLKLDKQDAAQPDEYFDEEIQVTCSRVEPKPPAITRPFTPPPPPEITCFICAAPVYFYEYEGTRASCMWCQKEVLDNAGEVC